MHRRRIESDRFNLDSISKALETVTDYVRNVYDEENGFNRDPNQQSPFQGKINERHNRGGRGRRNGKHRNRAPQFSRQEFPQQNFEISSNNLPFNQSLQTGFSTQHNDRNYQQPHFENYLNHRALNPFFGGRSQVSYNCNNRPSPPASYFESNMSNIASNDPVQCSYGNSSPSRFYHPQSNRRFNRLTQGSYSAPNSERQTLNFNLERHQDSEYPTQSYQSNSSYNGNFLSSNFHKSRTNRPYRHSNRRSHSSSHTNTPVFENPAVDLEFRQTSRRENVSSNTASSVESTDEIPPTVTTVIDIFLKKRFISIPLSGTFQKYGFYPEDLKNLAEENPDYFEVCGNLLSFKPKIKICPEYIQEETCSQGTMCSDLHLCLHFVLGNCQDKLCMAGHDWKTNHNVRVFEKFYMPKESLCSQYLNTLLSETVVSFKNPEDLLLCSDFDTKECIVSKKSCFKLHICLKYLLGNCKPTINNSMNASSLSQIQMACSKSHDIKNDHNVKVLMIHQINYNETPRDLMRIIMNLETVKIKLLQVKGTIEETTKQANASEQPLTLSFKTHQLNQSSIYLNSKAITTSDYNCFLDNTQVKQKIIKQKKTLWSHDLCGNVNIPEICYYSVEEQCRNEEQCCPRLHSTHHFHWQVQEPNGNWYNLPKDQTLQLETGYCDVNKITVVLPRLKPSQISAIASGLILVLGRFIWTANFSLMEITNSSTNSTMKIRRLCTEFIAGKEIKENIYVWYFFDINNQWIEYGKSDSAGQEKMKTTITSADIETHFVATPHRKFLFSNDRFKYYISFSSMKQVNMETATERSFRRRPKPHLQSPEKIATIVFPKNWAKMNAKDIFTLITLEHSSDEFQLTENKFKSENLSVKILKIERIQNPFLWTAFRNKVEEMKSVYGSEAAVNIKQLYHGTKKSVLPNICSENFDWRLYGTAAGSRFGQGAYFSPYASMAIKYCEKNSPQYLYVIVARVAVGTLCQGNSSMSRPPINPATKRPYDSTYDQTPNPKEIIKYDKQEYYPEYILTLS